MGKVVKVCTKLLEAISAAVLLVLTLMVFLNVMLRYTFNSGIVVTEELGRYFLVWILFVGSILAAGNNSHVRVDLFLNMLPRLPRAWVDVVCDLIMIYCCWLIVDGGWAQTILNSRNYLSVSGIPESSLYVSAFLAGVCIGAIILVRMIGKLILIFRAEPAQAEG